MKYSMLKYHLRSRYQRVRRAVRYALGRTTPDDAWSFYLECEDITGYHGLEGISENTVLEQCIERYGDMPELPRLVAEACSYVSRKWHSSGDTCSAAEDWAFELIRQNAIDENVVLVDSWDAEPAETEAAE